MVLALKWGEGSSRELGDLGDCVSKSLPSWGNGLCQQV